MLRAFEAVARHQSVTLAAAELHVTQGAVSHQVKALEHWLDAKLVQREGRRIALTTVGRGVRAQLVHRARPDGRCHAQPAAAGPPRAHYTVSAFDAGDVLADSAAGGLLRRNPAVDVDLSTNYARYDFDPAASDVPSAAIPAMSCAASCSVATGAASRSRALPWRTMTLVCSPALVNRRGCPLATLPDIGQHAMLKAARRQRSGIMVAGRPDRSPLAAHLTFDHVHLALNAALQGAGMALAPTRCWPS